MKASIDEFQPNASQTSYFEGFWRITSKTNAKIEVESTENLCLQFHEPAMSGTKFSSNPGFKSSEFRPAELFAFNAFLILMSSISEFMFTCF